MLLHGVGSDGHDLIGLAPRFRTALPDALFLSPHAPFPFDMAPFGRQWFSLQDQSETARLAGARAAAPILDAYIDDQLARHRLTEDRLVLIGFSQGTMMSLHVGPRRERPLAGIIGYSGMLAGADVLARDVRSRPPAMLVHGDADEIVPFTALEASRRALLAVGVEVEAHARPGLGHGIDETGIALGIRFLARVLGDEPS